MVSPHFLQDECASTLSRQMDMLADVIVLGDGLKQPLRKIFRVRGRKPEPYVGERFRCMLK